MAMKTLRSAVYLIMVLISGNLLSQTLAFPEAEGYGKYTTGGRGGRVVEVTNLLDVTRSGQPEPGSFREALSTPGDDPITIVFKVSGIIELNSELRAKRSNMTIAGQTAPGDGICIKGYTVNLGGSENVIIRYIRFRPGDVGSSEVSALRFENSKNIIIDHCSMSWAVEEIMGFYDNKYTTVQWCILSEGLYESIHKKGARSYASQWGGQYASYHHNLLAHNNSRSPRINGSQSNDTIALLDIRNNVIFNWGSQGAIYGGEEAIAVGKCETNFVNNYYQPGKMTSSNLLFARPSYKRTDVPATGYAGWYFSGNHMAGIDGGMNDDNWLGVEIISEIGSADNIRSDVEFEVSAVTTQSALEARDLVLEKAGATLPKRDDVDIRIVGETRGDIEVQGNGRIDSQSEVGGWPEYNTLLPLEDADKDGMPDSYEEEQGLDPDDAEDGKLIQANGYSNLEIYLNSITGITGQEEEVEVLHAGARSPDFVVSPNPGGDYLQLTSKGSISEITLYTIDGKTVFHHDLSNVYTYRLDIGGLKRSTYILKARLTDGSWVERKIIKE